MIQYIYKKYGRERAGLAATVICYRGRSAIREVGKVFGLSDDAIGVLASTLWGWSTAGVTQKEARRAGLDPSDPRLGQVMALAQELIGFPRHLSQHVGGFVITRSRLDEVVPIENAAMDERTVVEWDKDDLDDARYSQGRCARPRHAVVPAAGVRSPALGIWQVLTTLRRSRKRKNRSTG